MDILFVYIINLFVFIIIIVYEKIMDIEENISSVFVEENVFSFILEDIIFNVDIFINNRRNILDVYNFDEIKFLE